MLAVATAVIAGCGARTPLFSSEKPPAGPAVDAGAPSCRTTVSGTVTLPNGTDPLYDAVVYVPTGPLELFAPGVACSACGAPVTGSPVAKTRSGADGSFVLTGVPPGQDVPLVIQAGKWRRQVTIPRVTECASNEVDASLTHLPTTHAEGDMPAIALVTGMVDAMECVLFDAGIDPSELTGPSGGGRVQMFVDNGASDPSWGTLAQLSGLLPEFDMVLLPCDGEVPSGPSPMLGPVVDYLGSGGRLFTSHFDGYQFLQSAPFVSTVQFGAPTQGGMNGDTLASVETNTPDGAAFLTWLGAVGALSGQAIDISNPFWDIVGTSAPAQSWLTTGASSPIGVSTQLYSVPTPIGAAVTSACGAMYVATYHVAGSIVSGGDALATECSTSSVSPQELAYEFLLFDTPTCLE